MVGANGVNARKTVVMEIKLGIGFATALLQLIMARIVLYMDQVTQILECATRKVAQVLY